MANMADASIRAMAAATGSGERGACLFVLDENGILSFTEQEQPGGYWQVWQGPSFGGQPVPGALLACAGQNVGRLMLALLDEAGKVWTMAQGHEDGGWGGWEQPGISSQAQSWTALAAGQLSGPRGIALMAADDKGQVWVCYQMNPGADWSGWSTGLAVRSGGQPFAAEALALADQGNGKLILFALAKGRVAAMAQDINDLWGAWSPLGLAGQPTDLKAICACGQSGGGAQLWGLDAHGIVCTVAQQGAGGPWGQWQGPAFADQPEPFVRIAAADQNDGWTGLIGAGEGGSLWTIAQTPPAGEWGPWKALAAPPPT
ncbi:MAG: hypothetical protein QOJ27_1292 [Sphingomonadales bacterium]|nr:hypothetical protein [Sphingomonadales bacterium]